MSEHAQSSHQESEADTAKSCSYELLVGTVVQNKAICCGFFPPENMNPRVVAQQRDNGLLCQHLGSDSITINSLDKAYVLDEPGGPDLSS